MEKFLIIDVQGFKDTQNKFIIKELAAVGIHSAFTFHRLFQSPFDFRRIRNGKARVGVKWLTRHHHRLEWNSGTVPYDRLKCVMRTLFDEYGETTVLVKGVEKAKWISDLCALAEMTIPVVEMERNFGTPSLKDLKAAYRLENQCPVHSSSTAMSDVCALLQAQVLREWWIEYREPSETASNVLNYVSSTDKLSDLPVTFLRAVPVRFLQRFAPNEMEDVLNRLRWEENAKMMDHNEQEEEERRGELMDCD